MNEQATITAAMIETMTDAVAVNSAAATNGIAMKGEIDGYQVWFDLSGRDHDDPDTYTIANIINVDPID